MQPTDELVLPEEVIVFPVADINPALRASIGAGDCSYGLTKRNSRRTTRLIDKTAADLLEQFRTPSSVPDAIARFSRKSELPPERVLHDSFEFLSVMVRDGFLVRAASRTVSRLGPVDTTGSWRVLEPLGVLEDTEVHLVHSPSEVRGVLKRIAADADRWIRLALVNEARVLRKLNGVGAPELLEDGSEKESPYIVLAWRRGLPSSLAAAQVRRPWVANSRERLVRICARVLSAYADLHAQKILHGDVQPANVLIDTETETVSLIDFGLAVDEEAPSATLRGGVETFYPPEAARALLAHEPMPAPTACSEQYAVAVLLFQLFTGHDYLERRLDPATWREAVCTSDPRRFVQLGIPAWPALEEVLARALAKDPRDRYPSMSAFRDDFAIAQQSVDEVARRTNPKIRDWQPPGLFEATLHRLADPDAANARPLSRPTASLNYGATGIAYFLFRASGLLDRPDLFAAADLWIERAKRDAAASPNDAFFDHARGLTEQTVGKAALYHSAVGMHCVDALIACSANQPQRVSEAIGEMVEASSVPDRRADLVSGRAGQLIACAILLETLTAPGYDEDRERVLALGHRCREDLLGVWEPVDQTLAGASEAFFGIAHGWAGAAYSMLRFADVVDEAVPDFVTVTLRSLAGAARKVNGTASWPLGARNDQVWTGWCHGSAGYVFLWAQAQRSLTNDNFLELALMAGEHAWTSSPPETGHLCCGAAGQAYAFLALHRLTGDGKYIDRTRQRLEQGIGFAGTRGMSPDSLYKGDLGVALLEPELSEPLLAAMPMFERERWP
jgi:serine/threonine protein kinase